MQGGTPQERHGGGRQGLHVPCVFWPPNGVTQEIEHLVVSPDGSFLAAACSSGQVYTWRCREEAPEDQDRAMLEPAALALAGWLGPARVLALDFCRAGLAAEVAGLRRGQALLVCLMGGGTVRLLDPGDGRCVATVPPFLAPSPAARQEVQSAALRVLADGRHAAVTCLAAEINIVDLWSSRWVASLVVPGDAPLLRVAAPRWSGSGGGSLSTALEVAGLGEASVFVWRWSPPERSAAPCFSFSFGRGYGRTAAGCPSALALEGGIALFGIPGRLLLLAVGEADVEMDPILGVDEDAVVANIAVPGFVGAELLCLPMHTAPAERWGDPKEGRVVSGVSRRFRSWGPQLVGARQRVEHEILTLLAWTSEGQVQHASLCSIAKGRGGRTSAVGAPTLEPWGQFPDTVGTPQCCWWPSSGSSVVGAITGRSSDSIYHSAALLSSGQRLPRWLRASSLQDLWRPGVRGKRRESIVCAAAIEAARCVWMVVAFSGRGGICAIAAATGSGQPLPQPNMLQIPEHFGEPACMVALGPKFLVAADCEGSLCWWSLPGWTLAGKLPAIYRIPVVHLARVASTSGASTNPVLVAALDMLGQCRLVDIGAGEVRCVLQSQSGLSLWLEEPLFFNFDPVASYIFAETAGRTWVWDATSGAFQTSFPTPGSCTANGSAQETSPRKALASGSGLRGSSPSLEILPWQTAELATGAAFLGQDTSSGSIPVWRLGEVMLDGPLWRLPVAIFSPGSISSGGAASSAQTRSAASGASAATITASEPATDSSTNLTAAQIGEARREPTPNEASGPAGAPDADCTAAVLPWPADRREVEAQLVQLGLELPAEPFVVGVLGVDGSLGFPLPRSSGLRERSAPPGARDRAHVCARGAAPLRANGASRLFLRAGAEGARRRVRNASPPARGADREEVSALTRSPTTTSAQSGLFHAAQLLVHSDAPGPWLQRVAFPALRIVLDEAPIMDTISALLTWTKALRLEANDAAAPGDRALMTLRHAAFGSPEGLRDVAAALLAAVAVVRPQLFVQLCPPTTGARVAELLCAQMFGRTRAPRTQSLACEVFARGFPRWRPHLASVAPLRSTGRQHNAAGAPASAAASPAFGESVAATARAGGASAGVDAARRPGVERSQSFEPKPGGGGGGGGIGGGGGGEGASGYTADEDLEWLAAQALALYQEPRVASSCLGVLMQVGFADPLTLVHVMGRAARRVDLGTSYSASALFILVAFLHRFPAKLLPVLPRFAEAVLRCLEPSDPSLRRQSLVAVTTALRELVQTFPMVAFHQPSQKIAIGTGDALVVVYDLRTATKWRILEGHTGAVAAVAFSKDGGKLASYSGRDSSVRVWQCASAGFLGGLLGASGRCTRHVTLPPAASPGAVAAAASAAAAAAGHATPGAQAAFGAQAAAGAAMRQRDNTAVAATPWRAVTLGWTERGSLRLVRESGEIVQLQAD